MTTQENNIGNALLTAKEVITKMIEQGLGEDKLVFALTSMLSETYNLTRDQSIIVIEESFKMI